jgi:hypothetical protein
MMVDFQIINSGHPWDGRPGFELLEVWSDNLKDLLKNVEAFEKDHWHAWIVSNVPDEKDMFGAALYRPQSIKHEWIDTPKHPFKWVEKEAQ